MASEPKVTVYSFFVSDDHVARPCFGMFKATRKSIRELGGEVLELTAEEVDPGQLDDKGRFRRQAIGWFKPASHR